MCESYQPPAHGKQQPTAQEAHGEHDQGEAPFQIDQGGEDVLQEPPLFADVLVRYVAGATFGYEARLVYAVPKDRLSGYTGDEPRQRKLLGDYALSRQHSCYIVYKLLQKL